MNKTFNTILFMLGGVIFNIVMIITFMVTGIILVHKSLPENAPPILIQCSFIGVIILSIVLTFFIYHQIIQFLNKKIDLEKYFRPFFGTNKRKK